MNTLDFIREKYNVSPSASSPVPLPINRDQLAALFGELGFKVGAEIGVEQGKYSEVLARSIPGCKLYLVDAWTAFKGYRDHVNQEKLDGFFNATKERMRGHNATLVRAFSMEAVKMFKPGELDFVFIDAHHGFDYVMQDIIEWSKRVRSGGIVSGHDFWRPRNNDTMQFGVIEAVNAYTSAHSIHPWFLTNEERAKSWFWIKE